MSSLWLITTYFNPLGWRSRRRNYDIFRRHLDARLLTVSWSPEGNHELDDEDADILIRVDGGDLMWQKERLINIGLAHLPDDCDLVGWVDCDILFQDPLWQEKTISLLRDHEVIQLYGNAAYLEAGSPIDAGFRSSLQRPSIIQAWQSAENQDRLLKDQIRIRELSRDQAHYVPDAGKGSMGFAWAAQRSWLQAMGGLHDRWVGGSGDTACAMTFLGIHEAYCHMLTRCGLGGSCSDHLRRWANRVHASSPRLSSLKGTILHLHHGDLADRAYMSRQFDLLGTGFLPDEHLELDPSGAWRFNNAAPEQTRQMMASYFASRREDGPEAAQ